MANVTCAPSLSAQGWITDTASKADILLAWFFEAVKSETYLYGNNISNLQWLIEEYGSSIVDLTARIGSTLEVYLGRYYDHVVATVSSDDNAANLTGEITITIHCTLTDNGQQYSLGKLLQINNSIVTNIININNG